MKRICLIKGQSQYYTTRTFIDQLASAYSQVGHDVRVVDMSDAEWPSRLADAFSERLAFVFSFNAAGMDIATEEGSIYDRMQTRFIGWLMDHPMYHRHRLTSAVRRAGVLCVDRTHTQLVSRLGGATRPAGFMPHAGMQAAGWKRPIAERTLDVLFSGTYNDPDALKSQWNNLPGDLPHLTADIVEAALADPGSAIEVTARSVLERNDVWMDLSELVGSKPLILADGFIRARRRLDCLTTLANAGIRLHLFGDAWDKSPLAAVQSVNVHGPATYESTVNHMCTARIVLNVMPAFPAGSHDRVFCGMLNGAAVVTDSNAYLQDTFATGRDVEFFHLSQLEEFGERVHALLQQPERLQAQADSGRTIATAHHTWQHRAHTLENFAETIDGLSAS